MHSEMEQPHEHDTFEPKWVNELTKEEKKRALDLMLSIEEFKEQEELLSRLTTSIRSIKT